MSTGESTPEITLGPCDPAAPPQFVAFHLGRLLTQWHYYAVQSWLGEVEADHPVAMVLGDAAVSIRSLMGPSEREAAQQVIEELNRAWHVSLSLECHSEALFESRRRMAMTNPDQAALQREIDRLLAPVNEHYEAFEDAMTGFLSDYGRCFFNLGVWLERGECPSAVAYHVLSASATAPSTGATENATQSSWLGNGVPTRRESPDRLRTTFHRCAALAVPDQWWNGVQVRWQEIAGQLNGFTYARERLVEAGRRTYMEAMTAVVLLVREAAGLDGQPSVVREDLDAPQLTRTDYLGLLLDSDRYEVRRAGMDQVVVLSESRLHWEILVVFVNRRGRFTTPEDLEPVWERAGRARRPQEATIANVVSDLRRELAPLQIGISRRRWRLESVASTDHS